MERNPQPDDEPGARQQNTAPPQNDQSATPSEETAEAKVNLANFFRILSYGTAIDYALMATCSLASIGSGVAMPLMFVVFGNLVGDFTGYFNPVAPTVTEDNFRSAVNRNSLYIFYLFIAKFCLAYISLLTVRISGLRISSALRLAYLRALFAQPLSTVDTISPGKVSNRITNASNQIQLGISQQFALLVQSSSFVIGSYVVAFVHSWLLTLVASSSLPFILIAYSVVVPFYLRFHKAAENFQEKASSLAFEIFSSIRIVVAFGAEERLSSQHNDWLLRAKKSELRCSPLMGLMFSPSFFATYASFALSFWFGIRQYTRGNIEDIGAIVVVLFAVVMAILGISQMASPIIQVSKACTSASELFVTIDSKPPDTSGLRAPEVIAARDLTFKGVRFSYPSRPGVQVLDGLTVTFEVGKVTAIVGPSGCGKSTVVSLVERWYDLPQVTSATDESKDLPREGNQEDSSKSSPNPRNSGSIKLGDVNLLDVDVKWWRSQIGLVQQEPFLFNDTIYKNVAYGLCGTDLDERSENEKRALVQEACKEAFADKFICEFPLGYDTIVGESGIKMSGGQRQRIAIARSIIKRPPVLILDEATSAIDVRTERVVQAALDNVSKNRTTIVIAHRLSTIKNADKIVVVRGGRVVEEGNHAHLISMDDGVYRSLVNAQALTMGQTEPMGEDLAMARKDDEPEIATVDSRLREEGSKQHVESRTVDDAETPYEQKGFLRSYGVLLMERRRQWVLFAPAILAAMGCGAVYPVQAYVYAKLIEVFTLPRDQLSDRGDFWSLMFFMIAIATAVTYFTLGSASHTASVIISTYYRSEYLKNIVAHRIAFFDAEGNSAGSLTGRVSTDPAQIEKLMGSEMSMAFTAIFNLIGSVAIAFAFGWKLSLVGLFAILPAILLGGYYRVRLEMQFEQMNSEVFAESSQFATEAVGAFRTVISLIMEDMICDRYQTLLKVHVSKAFGRAKLSTLVFAASDSIELACVALCFWYGGQLLASREYGITQFFVIYMAITQGSQAAGIWFSFAPSIAGATGAANRIMSVRPLRPTGPESPYRLEKAEGSIGIDFNDVFFTYRSRNVPVLSGLNMKVKPGQFAALVGASGCGKSTIISLLERFYDPTAGSILCDGQDISSIDLNDYRSAIALVAQEPTLYEGSIRENVALSVEADAATDEAIQTACMDAQIHEFIASLPDGYATMLGSKGVSLSGGQKQRISLARALLRRPRLLLLDEATSSLDSTSEKIVQEAVEKAARDGNRTVLAVAHRLATIQKADVIFVLGSGKVLEKGDHQSLLNRRGVYYQMCQAQALDR